jgi:hypothetical protein
MKIISKVDKQSAKAVNDMLKQAEKVLGATSSEFVAIVAQKTAQRLAHQIQPLGFKNVEKFQGGIKSQVYKALHNAIREGDPRNPDQAHSARRNRRGRVPGDIHTRGQYKRAPYTDAEFRMQAERKARMAGYAKGSWVEAADNAGLGDLPDVPQVIRRHAQSGNGWARKNYLSLRPQVEIASRVPYMRRIISNAKITTALAQGRRNAIKYLERETRKRLRQVERIQKRAARETARAVAKFNKRAAREWAKRHKLPNR